ncbi:hypothetical protein [Burkholderia sp. HI2500]|uniref:hypothetical protein n=1 Tax=Burkholderia sp. HI2500 TaxID=2015358 RepID=UPI000B7A27CE|nr:hypothetical protein [Burkholderia sp. HI2500]OXJ16321.1 hypothetical protein CFB45_07070 [Burkholderia sp. HI2500]
MSVIRLIKRFFAPPEPNFAERMAPTLARIDALLIQIRIAEARYQRRLAADIPHIDWHRGLYRCVGRGADCKGQSAVLAFEAWERRVLKRKEWGDR